MVFVRENNDIGYKAYYHLPGVFEFYELYRRFLPLFRSYPEYFYDWCDIGSIYGAPEDCLWAGGRVEYGEQEPEKVLELLKEYGISARLTFSNSLLKKKHLDDKRCNQLCDLFDKDNIVENGLIIYSDILLNYVRTKYKNLYLVSSTTKVLNDFQMFVREVEREEFRYVVPDFRLNNKLELLQNMPQHQKNKVEFLCNECCDFKCMNRKKCYEEVSRIHIDNRDSKAFCSSPDAVNGYRFTKAMDNPGFIGIEQIQNWYLPMGFSQFKIEGRGLGSALVFEFLLYYLTKPTYHLHVREEVYMDNMLDLF